MWIKSFLVPSERKASYSVYMYTQVIDGMEQLNWIFLSSFLIIQDSKFYEETQTFEWFACIIHVSSKNLVNEIAVYLES